MLSTGQNTSSVVCIFGKEGKLSATKGKEFELFMKDEMRDESQEQGAEMAAVWKELYNRRDEPNVDFSDGQSWELNVYDAPEKKRISLVGGPDEKLNYDVFRYGKGRRFIRAFFISIFGDELDEAELDEKVSGQLSGLHDTTLSVLFRGHAWDFLCARFNVRKD